MSVQVAAPAGQFTLAIYGPNNSTLKPWDSALTWTGTLPATGDYYFDIASVLGDYAKSYTLFVSVTAP